MEPNKCEVSSLGCSLILQYDDQFPPLPTLDVPKKTTKDWIPRFSTNHSQSRTANVTQTLVVPLSERRFSTHEGSLNNDAQKKICQSVAQKCAVSIELNAGIKDQNLSLFINGPLENVQNAKKILSKELQTQTQSQLKVPKEYHKFILGKSGSTLREIESLSSTNISIPRTIEDCDIITIFGTKEGIERARFDISQIVSERSKLATERINIPRRFYPFINGPNNSNINRIRDLTNVKVNIPPPQAENEEIIISGEKEGVVEALSIIHKIYDDTKNNSSSLNLSIPKCQHRYVIGVKGSGINEILEKTGVSVEMPLQDSEDDTIVLYGPSEHLAPALSLVIKKSESMMFVTLDAPNWLHRFIIGKNGSNLNKILGNYERVFVNFQDESNFITIEGPKEDVKDLKVVIGNKIEELKHSMDIAELQVDPRFHRHIIGRNGANIQRLQDEFKVQIRMPSNNCTGQNSWTIKIEGDPDGVKAAKAEIESMSIKLENEKTKDVILNHKYHNQLIGANGNKIKEIRTLFPDVIIMFPDSSLKSDIVQLRGAREQVDQVALKLNKLIQEVIENNFVKEIRIFKQYNKNIIGKGCANIRKIRDEINVRIDFPDEQSDSDIVRIIGKKQNVLDATRIIEAMQSELINIKEATVDISNKLHSLLVGVRGKLIKSIQEECGGVLIQFPSNSMSNSIIIRGLESDVNKAKKMLLELSEKNQLFTHQETVAAKSEYHQFIIGRKGSLMAEFKKRHNVMVIFPDNEDVNKDVIQIIGAKDAVIKAKAELESTIKSMGNEIEQFISIDPKWHKHFFKRRQAIMEDINREFGGVRMYFPKIDAVTIHMDQVRVIGPKECVEAAMIKIKDIVENLEAQTSISVFIEQVHHRNLIIRNMIYIKAIQSEFDVTIKFPNKGSGNENNIVTRSHEGGNIDLGDIDNDNFGVDDINYHVEEVQESGIKNSSNLVIISGRKENCEHAKISLLELVPVTEEVPLCYEYHRNLIGQKGQGINTFSTKYSVTVNIPQASLCADHISMKGAMSNICDAKTALMKMVDTWEADKNDRIARNFELSVDVPINFHRLIIGQRGSNVEMFRNKFNVNIQIPDQNSGSSVIAIRGYEEDVKKAKDELCYMVSRLEAQVKEELHIPRDVHPLLIGTRGVNLRKLKEQFKVEINFPNRNAEGERAQLVEIIGDKDNVDQCCDYLIERANELFEEFEERNQYRGSQNSSLHNQHKFNDHSNTNEAGFTLSGAPWQRVPDSFSNDDFPTIDAGGGRSSVTQTCLFNGHSE